MNCSALEINLSSIKISTNFYLLVLVGAISIAISSAVIVSVYKKFKKQFNIVVNGITQSPLLERNKNMNYILNRKILRQLSRERDPDEPVIEPPKEPPQEKSSIRLQVPNQSTTVDKNQTTDVTSPQKKNFATKEKSASYFDIINSIAYRAEEFFAPSGCVLYLPYIFGFIMLLSSFFMWWISLAFNLIFEFGLGYLCHKSLVLPRNQFRPKSKIIMYSIISSVQLLWEVFLVFLLVIILGLTFRIRTILVREAASYGTGIECYNMDAIARNLDMGFEGCGMIARMTQYNFFAAVALILITIPTTIIKILFTILIPSHYIKLRIENIPTNT